MVKSTYFILLSSFIAIASAEAATSVDRAQLRTLRDNELDAQAQVQKLQHQVNDAKEDSVEAEGRLAAAEESLKAAEKAFKEAQAAYKEALSKTSASKPIEEPLGPLPAPQKENSSAEEQSQPEPTSSSVTPPPAPPPPPPLPAKDQKTLQQIESQVKDKNLTPLTAENLQQQLKNLKDSRMQADQKKKIDPKTDPSLKQINSIADMLRAQILQRHKNMNPDGDGE